MGLTSIALLLLMVHATAQVNPSLDDESGNTQAPERAPLQSEEKIFRDGRKTWTYQKTTIHGWTVYLENSLADDETLTHDLYAELKKSFASIKKEVPREPLKFLKTIPVWISEEPDYPMRANEKGTIPFHRSAEWLRERGYNPHMAPGVHVINPRAVLYEHKVFDYAPMTILHELAHAYHNLVLKLDDRHVKKAYRNAKSKGLYLRVPDRSNPDAKAEAYANTNEEEYFAELTEAYFGQNDWYPRDRQQLKDHDPIGYAMVEKTWRVTKDGTD
jgi:hypothetical protein